MLSIKTAILPVSLIVAPLLLGMPLPVAAQTQTTPPAATSDDDQASFSQKAGAEMQEWQHKIDAFATKAKADGKHASADTQAAFDDAWVKSKDAAERLKKSSKAGWADAKKYYDTQTDNLAAAWKRMTDSDK
jgi:hypothetical protein